MTTSNLESVLARGFERLLNDDPELLQALAREHDRQCNQLVMVASSSVVHPSVLICQGATAANVTAEGYPGNRYHAGCEAVDLVERLAVARAKAVFRAGYANVQPHSATSANQIVISRLVPPGGNLLGMRLDCGGHLTHGSKVSITGRYFNASGYGLVEDGTIDYRQVAALARETQPRLIVCGATAYPHVIDFEWFRRIADEVGAFLLADISHIAGLIIAGLHPSPIDHAHVTTTCTHKQLFGPRGGLILTGRDGNCSDPRIGCTLNEALDNAVFPFFQGAPHMSTIAAKACALKLAGTEEFATIARRIVANSAALANALAELGYRVVGGGTSNHIVLVDLTDGPLTGLVAQRALEACDIIVNKNPVPNDRRRPAVASGIRLGTNTLAVRGLGPEHMRSCARLIDAVLSAVEPRSDAEYALPAGVSERVPREVSAICARFPLPYASRLSRTMAGAT